MLDEAIKPVKKSEVFPQNIDPHGLDLLLDEDVLQGAKETAAMEGTPPDEIISDWARRGFFSGRDQNPTKRILNSVPLLPSRGKIVTMKIIQEIITDR